MKFYLSLVSLQILTTCRACQHSAQDLLDFPFYLLFARLAGPSCLPLTRRIALSLLTALYACMSSYCNTFKKNKNEKLNLNSCKWNYLELFLLVLVLLEGGGHHQICLIWLPRARKLRKQNITLRAGKGWHCIRKMSYSNFCLFWPAGFLFTVRLMSAWCLTRQQNMIQLW